jgi:hypothetical protein
MVMEACNSSYPGDGDLEEYMERNEFEARLGKKVRETPISTNDCRWGYTCNPSHVECGDQKDCSLE